MRKFKYKISLFLFFIIVCQNLSFSQTLWEQWVSKTSSASKIITTFDKGYVVCVDGTFLNSYIVKYDSLGNIKWDTMDTPCLGISINDFIETPDNNYIVIGNNFTTKVIQKYDSKGHFLWEKYYDNWNISAIVEANNEHIITIGGGFFNKFDNKGLLISEGGHLIDNAGYVSEYNNTMILESSNSIEKFNEDFQCINKKNNSFNLNLNTISSDGTKLVCIQNLYNSTKIAFVDVHTLDSIFSKISLDFNIGQSQDIIGIISTPDNGYLLFGIAQIGGPQYHFIIKLDSIGDVQWSRTYHFGTYNIINSIVNATDGEGYVLLVSNSQEEQSFLVRVGTYGELLGICNDSIPLDKTEDFISIFPNPASNIINFSLQKKIDGQFKIYDLNGNLLQTGIIENEEKGLISISQLKNGVYIFIIIQNDNKTNAKIFIKQL